MKSLLLKVKDLFKLLNRLEIATSTTFGKYTPFICCSLLLCLVCMSWVEVNNTPHWSSPSEHSMAFLFSPCDCRQMEADVVHNSR